MTMRGIDIASYQAGMNIYNVDADFVIVKVSEGTDYQNTPDYNSNGANWRNWASQVLDSGKLLGLYHYANGEDIQAEAEYFCNLAQEYAGRAVMVLDWEGSGNDSFDQHGNWTRPWLEYVANRFGTTPLLYISASLIPYHDWPHLWIAQYDNYDVSYYQDCPWNEGAYDCLIRQYKGTGGRVSGYDGDVDLNKAYFDRDYWHTLIGNQVSMSKPQETSHSQTTSNKWLNPAEIAARDHAFMCNCDEGYGYDWDNRFGDANNGIDYVEYEGHVSTFWRGQRDCSSSVIDCWREALTSTKYEGCLDAATYTGNIESVFCGSGLFEAKPMSFVAERGDLYLNTQNHVAMCQTQYPDVLSEFSIGETGGVYGNQPGDQTGREAYIHDYYDYPWDMIIHYVGGDLEYFGIEGNDSTPDYTPPVSDSSSSNNDQPRYNINNGSWCGDMIGTYDTTNCGDDYAGEYGKAAVYIAIDGVGEYKVESQRNGWLDIVNHYDINDYEYGCAGDGSAITKLTIYDDSVHYQVHTINGEWLPEMIGTHDTGGSSDDFAGNGEPIDLVRIWR